MGFICVAQERQPNHYDNLIACDGARCHAISPSHQLGFPIVHGLYHSQFRIKIFSETNYDLSANTMSTPNPCSLSPRIYKASSQDTFGRNVHTFQFNQFSLAPGKFRPPTAPDYAAQPGLAIYFYQVNTGKRTAYKHTCCLRIYSGASL